MLALILAGVGTFCIAVLSPTLFLLGILTIPGLLVWKWRRMVMQVALTLLVAMAIVNSCLFCLFPCGRTPAVEESIRVRVNGTSRARTENPGRSEAIGRYRAALERRTGGACPGGQADGLRALMLQRLHDESVNKLPR